jgi:hypothetical protein
LTNGVRKVDLLQAALDGGDWGGIVEGLKFYLF